MSSSSATIRTDIEKFDGNKVNFSLWQVRMTAVLVQQKLKKALLGKEKKPVTMKDEDWDDMDERAVSTIQLHLVDEVLREVLTEKTAEGLWKKLEASYASKLTSNKLVLKQSLYTLRMKEGTKIKDHINEFNTIIADLEQIDVSVDDEDKALLLLISLPQSFNNFRDTLIYGSESLTLEGVKAKLKSKEKLDGHVLSNSSDQGEGLVARGISTVGSSSNRRNRDMSNNRHKNLTCNSCRLKGHIRRYCPSLKEEERTNGKGKEKSAEVGYAEDDDSDALVVTDDKKLKEEWILDSGSSFHICPNREWFSRYESVQGGVVFMGNNASCKIVGRGTVRIKMHDGVIRKLSDVKHVPELRKSIISLGTLDKRGCRYTAEGGVLKVLKGSRILVQGRKVGNIYMLQGSTVKGSVAEDMPESSSESPRQESAVEKVELETTGIAHEHGDAVKERYSTAAGCSREIRPIRKVPEFIANALSVAVLEENSEQLGSREISSVDSAKELGAINGKFGYEACAVNSNASDSVIDASLEFGLHRGTLGDCAEDLGRSRSLSETEFKHCLDLVGIDRT